MRPASAIAKSSALASISLVNVCSSPKLEKLELMKSYPATRNLYFRALASITTLWLLSNTLRAKPTTELVFEWTPALCEAIQTSSAAPCLASRNLAIIYISAFEAANAPSPKYQSYLGRLPEMAGEINPGLASVAALSFSSVALFPSQKGSFIQLYREQLDELRKRVDPDVWTRSVRFGEAIAKQALASRAADGSTSSQTYYPKDQIGKWKRTWPSFRPPELTSWSQTAPFGLKSSDQFRLAPPHPLDSAEYAAAFEEVRELGAKNSKTRTADQTEIAHFWSCFSYTSTPAGHWFEIATRAARDESIDLLDSLRLLALLNLSMADAGIACWDTKYFYESWRPIQAIHQADQDGNPSTEVDPNWDSLLEAPPHPEYTSGHGAFSGAGGRIMEIFFEQEKPFTFSTSSSSLPGVARKYKSIAECTDEICDSRLYGGIHFQYSNLRGRDLGEQVANYINERLLLPL